jgi:hypothetical protein
MADDVAELHDAVEAVGCEGSRVIMLTRQATGAESINRSREIITAQLATIMGGKGEHQDIHSNVSY